MKKNLKLISNIIGTVIPSLKGSDTDRSIDSTYEKDEIENAPEDIIEDISNNSSTLSLNEWLLQIKEIYKFYEITRIQPKYLIYLLGTILCFIIVNYFSKAFTLLIGVIYPMHCSIRTLIKKKKNREEIKKWLEYWIVFFLFINIETIFRNVLEKINMYLFYKVVFLSICFLPWYNGAHYIYNSFLKGWFTSYEKTVCKLSQKIAEKFKKQFFVEDIYDE
jgi:hypothetical protein